MGIIESFQEASTLLNELCSKPDFFSQLNVLSARLSSAFKSDGKVILCGNGGSMADSVHFAEELTGRFRNDRRPLPAIAIAEAAHLSCVANDYGFEHVFSRSILALGTTSDILILLTTSGNSQNLVAAAEAGKEKQMFVCGLGGRGGGQLKPLCDLYIDFPGRTSDRIQELQMLSLHTLVESIEAALFNFS